jgi:hypothetical protein
VTLEGGPHGGKSFTFSQPLPSVIVMVETRNGFRYSDYRRVWERDKGARHTYLYVDPARTG